MSHESTPEEKEDIKRAKRKLMNDLHMSEPQAHNFILKNSMQSRRSKAAIAQIILKTERLL